jgi:hypothetical protein
VRRPSSPGTAAALFGSIGHSGQALVDVAAPDDDLGVVEHVGHRVGDHDGDVVGAVVEELRGAIGEGRFGVDQRGQRIEVDEHRLGGVDGLAERLGDHHRHRLTHEPDPVACEGPAGEGIADLDEPVGRRQTEIVAGVDGHHPGGRSRLGGVDLRGCGHGPSSNGRRRRGERPSRPRSYT